MDGLLEPGDREEALTYADEYAAAHVTIMTADPDRDAKQLTGAGSVYVGRWAPESAGDYATGANHVLPTGGLAAAAGPLSVEVSSRIFRNSSSVSSE